MAEIGDVNNFRSGRQILKLAGLDLAKIQSGQYSGQVHISKRGKVSLRSAAFQAALVAARNDTNLRMKYLDLVQRKEILKGERRKAVVALACKILRIAYAVMKYKKPYDESYHLIEKEEDKIPVVV
jgi:transposase